MNALSSIPSALIVAICASTGSVAMAWIVTFFLHRKSASLRHLLWLLALAAPLFALPAAWMHVRVAVPILPPASQSTAVNDTALQANSPSEPTVIHDELSSATSSPTFSLPGPSRHEWAWPFNPWLTFWFLGSLTIVLRVIYSQMKVHHLVHLDCRPAPEELIGRLNRVRKRFHTSRSVRLMVTTLANIPFCHGALRPTIVFPENGLTWSDERIDVCLTHEFAHIVRGDLAAMLVGQLTCILCWFNPLVWLAAGRLRGEAENAADDIVLAKNVLPEIYAANLLAITEQYRASALAPTIALSMARPSRLKTRIVAVLDSTLRRTPPSRATIAAVSLLALTALLTVMDVRLAAAPASGKTTTNRDLAQLDSRDAIGIWNDVFEVLEVGDLDTLHSYLDRGLDVNFDKSQESLLYLAIGNNHPDIVRFLISRGADVNQKTSNGDTPIMHACWIGNQEIADLLIKAGAKPDPLHYAVGMGRLADLRALDGKLPIPPDQIHGLLSFSAGSGRSNSFEWLWTKLPAMTADQKASLADELYITAAQWGQAGILPVIETKGVSLAKSGPTALGSAAFYDHPDVVSYLLGKGVPAGDIPDESGQTILRQIVGEPGHLAIVKLLLDHGARINFRDTQGMTPLSWAAYMGNEEACKYLLNRGADGSIQDNRGENSAWHAGGGVYCPDVLDMLIKRGVKVTGKNKVGQGVLNAALQFMAPRPGHPGFAGNVYGGKETESYDERERRCMNLLVGAGADINDYEPFQTPLLNAISGGHLAAARALIEDGANLNFKDPQGNTTLAHISRWAWLLPLPTDILETMLDRGCDPNTIYHPDPAGPKTSAEDIPVVEEAMTTAVGSTGNLEHIPERETSYREAVKILLRHGAVFPQAGPKVQALLAAAAQDDLPGVRNAVQQGASVNSADAGGWTALTISLALGYRDVTDWLIQQGADSKTHTQQGYSPLLFAANRQDAGLVEQFIANGAKPDPGDHSGLDEAISNKNQRIFDDLVRAGANAGAIDLSSCIQKGQVAMAKTLLDAGANPDPPHPMENRNTVYWAVYYNQPEILKLLLAHGANPNLKDDYGDTPLSSAQRFHHDLVPILEAALKGTGK